MRNSLSRPGGHDSRFYALLRSTPRHPLIEHRRRRRRRRQSGLARDVGEAHAARASAPLSSPTRLFLRRRSIASLRSAPHRAAPHRDASTIRITPWWPALFFSFSRCVSIGHERSAGPAIARVWFFKFSPIRVHSPQVPIMEVAKVSDGATSLVESSQNISSAMTSVKSSKSVQSVQTKSVIESSKSVKSVTSTSSRSQRSVEVEEEIEYTE